MEERRARCEDGVSLIETLIALLILSFVTISTLAMFSQGMRLNAAGADYASITSVAKDKTEELLSLDYANADLNPNAVHEEIRYDPKVAITWRVAEHSFVQGNNNPEDVFNGANMTSTAAGTGNVKVIAVTVNSRNDYAAGRRSVTVQGILHD